MHFFLLDMSRTGNRAFIRKVLLVSLWVLGLLSGCFWVRKIPVSSLSLMRTLVDTRASIVGLLLVSFFPLVISAIALWFSKTWLLYLLAFLKAFLFGFAASCIMTAFGNSGWLLRWLVLFSDSLMSVCFLWLWLKGISSDNANKELLTSVLISALVFCIDYCAVSPFLMMLFDH